MYDIYFYIQGREKLVVVKQTHPEPVEMTFIAEPGKAMLLFRREGFRDKLDMDIDDQYMLINLQVLITTFSVLRRHI